MFQCAQPRYANADDNNAIYIPLKVSSSWNLGLVVSTLQAESVSSPPPFLLA